MPSTDSWPPSSSIMAEGLRSHDWSDSTLGSPERWPMRLRHAVESALEQKLPVAVAWGPELIVCAFNDSYRDLLGIDVDALGKPLLDLWDGCRERVAQFLQRCRAGEALLISELGFVQRNSRTERVDFALSPLRDDAGQVAGLLNTCTDPSGRIAADRRQTTLHDQLSATRAEAHQQAQLLDAVMSSIQEQIYVWDADLRFIYANRATEKLWGLERSGYIGKRLKDLNYPRELVDALESEARNVLAAGETVTGEAEHISPDGRRAFYNYIFSPIIGRNGKPQLVVGVSRDMTERIQLESKLASANRELQALVQERTRNLHHSEQRYLALFKTIDQGFCVIQLLFDTAGSCVDYLFIETNPAFERHTGLADAEGKTARQLVSEMDDHLYEVYGRVAKTGRSERFLHRSRSMQRWFEIDAFRIGEPRESKVALLFRDVSERKRAEDEVLRVLGLLEGITRSSEDLIAAVDKNCRLLYLNAAFRDEYKKLRGRAISEGDDIFDGMERWPDEQHKARALWHRALSGESFRVQHDFGPSEEEKRSYDLRFNPVYSPQGQLVGAAHIFRDVSEQVEVQDNLRRSEERLRESDRRKDEYLAMLGHELRNPLAALRSATELIKHLDNTDPRLQRASGVLERQTKHMARLVDGLLEVSRIARGKIDLNAQAVDLREILQEIIEDRAPQFDTRRIHLKPQMPSRSVWVEADPVRLAQVFDNVLGNAIKFTPASGTVTVTLEQEDGCALVRVADTGVGLRSELLERIFEPFYQEKQDIARATGGLGLGLALASSLLQLHRGSIKAHSPGPGRGTTFVIRLPLGSEAPPASASAPVLPNRPLRVLVVEDNLDAGQALRDLLELQGHQVKLAASAPEGLNSLWAEEFDVVLCDLGLPGMSGYDLARAVRRDDKLQDLPLIALTGYGQPEDRQRSRAAGFDEHLTKPVDLQALDRALGQVMVEA